MSGFVFWANKGGIGKSTLTFQLAASFAKKNKKKKVLVVDLSPQCDVSRIILGGGHNDGEKKILDIMSGHPRRTVQSFLLDCLNDVPTGNGWPNPDDYIIDPNDIRNDGEIPSNLKVLCGDFDLERAILQIERLPQPPRRGGRLPSGPHYSAAILSRSFLKHLVDYYHRKGWVVFIDTDPYFNVITTHMALLGAKGWITAYSPTSQASQYAVLRSVEFMYEPSSGLDRYVKDELSLYPLPWFDNRGNPLTVPDISVAEPYMVLANMVNPYKLTGNQGYTDPQKLHRQTIDAMKVKVRDELALFNEPDFLNYSFMWDMRRLGLICDFNGVGLGSLNFGSSYHQPSSNAKYNLSGNPAQLAGYKARLDAVTDLL